MKQTKKRLFQINLTKGDYLLCVVVKEITVAGGSSFSFSCSSAVETAAALIQLDAATTTAAVDAEITDN